MGALSGCAGYLDEDYLPFIENNVAQQTLSGITADEGEEAATDYDISSLPMDPSVMTPWMNSNIAGMVTMDVTESYKDDFYYAVNHDWLRDAKFKPGMATEASFLDASWIVQDRCLSFLADENLTGDDADLIQNYYELYLDWDGRNAAGVMPIKPFVDSLMEISSLDDMTEFLLTEENYKYGTFLIPVGLSTYAEDSTLYEVAIRKPNLLLGDAAEYTELTPNGERTKAYREGVASYMLGRFGMSDKEIEDTLAKAWAFDEKLSKFQKTVLEQYDPSYLKESVNMVTMEEIEAMSPDFPLPEYLEKFGWAESKLLDVEWPEAIEGLNSLYTEENLEELKAELLVRDASSYIDSLDEEAYREAQRLMNEITGTKESEPDNEAAFYETRSFFPDSFARLYKDRYLTEEMKDNITKICEDCIDTYSEMMDEEDWLSEETRSYAKEKLSKMTIHAVYPEKWEDYSIYHVKPADEGGTYFEAVMDYSLANTERDRSRINGKVDKDIWGIDILDTNAFYKPYDNSINIIPGFFCDYTYSEDMSIEQIYGAIGCVIGHEISHGFDTNGAQFDADGNMADWWSKEDYATFQERAGKLIDYYDHVVAFDDGTPYQGQIVQTEAIADMAGMKCILKMAEKIEGFDYDEFFKAYELLWARISTLESCESSVMTDSHPLHYLRGNVTVQQFDEFLDTYGIKEGDGMYLASEDRILVW